MAKNLNITISAPQRKNHTDEQWKAEVDGWKDLCLWALKTLPVDSVSTPAAPTLPSVASAPTLSNGAEKGQWEKAWIEKSGKKSVRFTTRIQALYPDKESYCRALCEGTARDDSGEDESPATAAPPVEVGEDWN